MPETPNPKDIHLTSTIGTGIDTMQTKEGHGFVVVTFQLEENVQSSHFAIDAQSAVKIANGILTAAIDALDREVQTPQ